MLHGEERISVSSFNLRLSPPQSWLFVPSFAVLPSNFKRPYLFNRSADLGEFYVKSKGFPCSTWKLSDFGRMDEKRGGLSSSCGAFSGLKIPGMALLVTWGTGLRTGARFVCTCCPRSVDATWGRTKLPFQVSTSVYRPRKVGCLCCFRRFALQLQKAISFQPLGRFG